MSKCFYSILIITFFLSFFRLQWIFLYTQYTTILHWPKAMNQQIKKENTIQCLKISSNKIEREKEVGKTEILSSILKIVCDNDSHRVTHCLRVDYLDSRFDCRSVWVAARQATPTMNCCWLATSSISSTRRSAKVAFVVGVTINRISLAEWVTCIAAVCVNSFDDCDRTDWRPSSGQVSNERDSAANLTPSIDSIHSNSMNRVNFAWWLRPDSGPVNICGRWAAMNVWSHRLTLVKLCTISATLPNADSTWWMCIRVWRIPFFVATTTIAWFRNLFALVKSEDSESWWALLSFPRNYFWPAWSSRDAWNRSASNWTIWCRTANESAILAVSANGLSVRCRLSDRSRFYAAVSNCAEVVARHWAAMKCRDLLNEAVAFELFRRFVLNLHTLMDELSQFLASTAKEWKNSGQNQLDAETMPP